VIPINSTVGVISLANTTRGLLFRQLIQLQ